MRNAKALSAVLWMMTAAVSGCATAGGNKSGPREGASPAARELHEAIARADEGFFGAYNTCDLEKLEAFIAEDIEFYHDLGGLLTSRAAVVAAVRDNICGRITRELVKGSLEVYPIAHFGAVAMGAHRFRATTEEAGAPGQDSRFVLVWQRGEEGAWKVKRVISVH